MDIEDNADMRYESTVHIVASGKHYSPGDDLSEVRTSTLRCMLRLGQAIKVEQIQPAQEAPPVLEAEPLPSRKKKSAAEKTQDVFAGGDKE